MENSRKGNTRGSPAGLRRKGRSKSEAEGDGRRSKRAKFREGSGSGENSSKVGECIDLAMVQEPKTDTEASDQYIPGLNEDLGLLCLAKVPRSEHAKLRLVSQKFCSLVESDELYKVRRRNMISEPWVYIVASGQQHWQAFDPIQRRWRRLPVVAEADYCYHNCDRESFSVGEQLMVVAKTWEGLAIWSYNLASNRWAKGSMMNTPRCLYAWASSNNYLAYFAGGITPSGEILQSVEQYNPESGLWQLLPFMNKPRKLCSGCFLDDKFYVVGGENLSETLSCAEIYDPVSKQWTLLPNMLPRSDFPPSLTGAPPLIAVVKNELYLLEAESHLLKVYMKNSHSWKVLGESPVKAVVSGWGIAFRALGEQLLVIGGARTSDFEDGMYVCMPDPQGTQLHWEFLTRLCPFGPFVVNCAIVSA